jgi:hypothetical protein
MTERYPVITQTLRGVLRSAACLLSLTLLIGSPALHAEPVAPSPAESVEQTLDELAREREQLTKDLAQYKTTIDLVGNGQAGDDATVEQLTAEMNSIRQRLIALTEREVGLLQRQIAIAHAAAQEPSPGMESRPLRSPTRDFTLAAEAENVARLLALISQFYAELQESLRTMPTPEELAKREAARKDAQTLARIPFSASKVRLSGAEGSTALAQISQRLGDVNIPESRRDVAPICTIKTRLFGSLVGSEKRSLQPVGKHHYIAQIRLQPGDTSLTVRKQRWNVRLPEDVSAGEYLVTLYAPPGSEPELHVFSVDDLLAESHPHIPAWLPADINLSQG